MMLACLRWGSEHTTSRWTTDSISWTEPVVDWSASQCNLSVKGHFSTRVFFVRSISPTIAVLIQMVFIFFFCLADYSFGLFFPQHFSVNSFYSFPCFWIHLAISNPATWKATLTMQKFLHFQSFLQILRLPRVGFITMRVIAIFPFSYSIFFVSF